jgi:UDP-N-acetylglucosamine:LPS N-acetylglucosamine transferase
MERIARELDDVQLLLMCGHNEGLARRLERHRSMAPHAVLGFTREVRRYLQLGDFFIGKPGPGSLSEAVHVGLPVITFRNAWTMPQERYNAEWVREHGLGLVLASPRGIRAAVQRLIDELDHYRARVERVPNRAAFELPGVIARVLAHGAKARAAEASAAPDPLCAALPAD